MTTRIIEQPEVLPRWSDSAQFISRMPIPSGLIRGIAFDISGTPVGPPTDNQDDAPWTLLSSLEIVIPLLRGDVKIVTTGRDLFLLSRYMVGQVRANAVAASTAVFFGSFYLPFGPPGWGFHSQALRPNSEIIVKGVWAAPAEYGTATTSITLGRLIPTLHVEAAVKPVSTRRALLPTTTVIPIESAQRIPAQRLNKPDLAEALFAVLYRQDDSSVAADRVDGLITRLVLSQSIMGTLHDQTFVTLRAAGLEWSGIDDDEVAVATPRGLDGTAWYVAAPNWIRFPALARAELELLHDGFETVPAGTANVANGAGDRLHATVVATLMPGA